MFRSFTFRIYPTKSQERLLDEYLDLTRELYNSALQERIDAWKKQRKRIKYFDQTKQIPDIRSVRPEFGKLCVNVQRGALLRLHRAFESFFESTKTGIRKGFPRFKNKQRWSTLSFEDLQKSPIIAGGKRVCIQGTRTSPNLKIKVKLTRPVVGTPKIVRVCKICTKWYVSIVCEDVPKKLLPKVESEIGIDLGLTNLATTSDGQFFANPRFLKKAKSDLARASRSLERKTPGSSRRLQAQLSLAKKHRHIANLRRENCIQVAKKLVSVSQTLYVERLNITQMTTKSERLRVSIKDAGWSVFIEWLLVKAEEAGREVIAVEPAYTSQACSSCGTIVPKGLHIRTHDCTHCELRLDRDINAAINIMRFGQSQRGDALPTKGTSEIRKAQVVREPRFGDNTGQDQLGP